MRIKLAFLASAALLQAAACGKSDVEEFADEYCGEVAKCCKKFDMGSGGMCRTLFGMPGAEDAYNKSAGDACLAETRALVAAGTFCSPPQSASSPCESVFEDGGGGKQQPGEACDFESDCAPSSAGTVACASAYDGSEWTSKCQVRLPGKAGDPCLGTQDGDVFSSIGSATTSGIEPEGYVCDTADGLECASGACAPLAAVGRTCSYSDDCVRDAFCDDASRQCVARVAAGAACTGGDDVECVEGYYCPAASPRQCTVKLPLGAACGASTECQSGNCESGACGLNLAETFGWALLCADF